jgi:hypothetical protein
MPTKEIIQKRFDELAACTVAFQGHDNGGIYGNDRAWGTWSSSASNLLHLVFGFDSSHSARFEQLINSVNGAVSQEEFDRAFGTFLGAKADYERDCYGSLERKVSGEVFGDFIVAAKKAFDEGNKDVAAVLGCAALEDALKRFANLKSLNVDGKDMSEVIGALKSKGLVGGAQKSILETMPKTRNNAMHADWSKISAPEVGAVIGFTERFLLDNF